MLELIFDLIPPLHVDWHNPHTCMASTYTSGATEWSCGMTGRLRYMVILGPPTALPPSAVTAGRRDLY